MDTSIKTRILIISDTHGRPIAPEDMPTMQADVAIHCGDLTDGSKLTEFRDTTDLIKRLNSPLKLVISGNHDFSMDGPALRAKIKEANQPLSPDLVAKEYGSPETIQNLFDNESSDGVILLHEGTHVFNLQNGAQLKVYASPYTPSLGAWGFQYHPDKGRTFAIEDGTDIVITHGPPKGIMDMTYGRERAGCNHLFAAVARSRPKVHCFGHIHEGWGAKLVRWKGSGTTEAPTHFTAIDNDSSKSIAKLTDFRASRFDTEDRINEKRATLKHFALQKCASTPHCDGDESPLEPGKDTLFVNASIESGEDFPQRPWLVELQLPAVGHEPQLLLQPLYTTAFSDRPPLDD